MIDKRETGSRLKHEGHEPFEMLSREVLQGVKDMETLGLWCYLRSLPESWIVRERQVREHFGIGRDRYQKCMRSLRELGLVNTVTRKGEDGRIQDRELVVYRSFGDSTDSRKNLQPEKPTVGEPSHLENTDLLEKTQNKENTQGDLFLGEPRAAEISAPKAKGQPEKPDGFDQFWAIYPRRVAKPKARSSWLKLSDDERKQVIVTLSRDPFGNTEAKFIPHPTTYLNQRRWEDEQPATVAGIAGIPSFGGML